ncbi:MAG: hypothetical protein JWN77_3168 [Frankiales bacterium]|nr:hypothetical protein [Frankiales bacterium]
MRSVHDAGMATGLSISFIDLPVELLAAAAEQWAAILRE